MGLRAGPRFSVTETTVYAELERIFEREKGSGTVKGGETLYESTFDDNQEMSFRILRDLMLAVLKDCTQMQVRCALKRNIQILDEWSGTSAVESLGRIVQMRVA